MTLLTSCAFYAKEINWDKTPLTATILGTYNAPSTTYPSKRFIRIQLASGEKILIKDREEIPIIIKGKQITVNRGIGDNGAIFYRFTPSEKKIIK